MTAPPTPDQTPDLTTVLAGVRFPNPVFIGDTIYGHTVIKSKRESKSRPEWGIVTFEHQGINQRGEVVCTCVRNGMLLKLPTGDAGTSTIAGA